MSTPFEERSRTCDLSRRDSIMISLGSHSWVVQVVAGFFSWCGARANLQWLFPMVTLASWTSCLSDCTQMARPRWGVVQSINFFFLVYTSPPSRPLASSKENQQSSSPALAESHCQALIRSCETSGLDMHVCACTHINFFTNTNKGMHKVWSQLW